MTSEAFSARLRAITPNRGDLSELSRESGIPVRTITRWARDQGEPQVTELVKIAEATGCTLEWLATGRGPVRVGEPTPGEPSEPKAVFDADVMREVIVTLEQMRKRGFLRPKPEEWAKLIVDTYMLTQPSKEE